MYNYPNQYGRTPQYGTVPQPQANPYSYQQPSRSGFNNQNIPYSNQSMQYQQGYGYQPNPTAIPQPNPSVQPLGYGANYGAAATAPNAQYTNQYRQITSPPLSTPIQRQPLPTAIGPQYTAMNPLSAPIQRQPPPRVIGPQYAPASAPVYTAVNTHQPPPAMIGPQYTPASAPIYTAVNTHQPPPAVIGPQTMHSQSVNLPGYPPAVNAPLSVPSSAAVVPKPPALPYPVSQPAMAASGSTRKERKEKKAFYDVEFEDERVKKMGNSEVFGTEYPVVESTSYGKNKAFITITNSRLILLTEHHNGGLYWPLKTTSFIRSEGGLFGKKKFFYKYDKEDKEYYVALDDKKDIGILETLFSANKELGEYDHVEIRNKSNILAVFNDECDTVIRFCKALEKCNGNVSGMFIWLLTMESILSIVKRQVRAAANAWSKSVIGSTAIDNFEMLDSVSADSGSDDYYQQTAKQISEFFTTRCIMKDYSGTIPLLDAYYYYGKVTANSLKSPDEFVKACQLLTEETASQNHIYMTQIKGKDVLCSESVSGESAEKAIVDSIHKNGGRASKKQLVKELNLPLGIADAIITKVEKKGKITRDSSNADVYYYENIFGLYVSKCIAI